MNDSLFNKTDTSPRISIYSTQISTFRCNSTYCFCFPMKTSNFHSENITPGVIRIAVTNKPLLDHFFRQPAKDTPIHSSNSHIYYRGMCACLLYTNIRDISRATGRYPRIYPGTTTHAYARAPFQTETVEQNPSSSIYCMFACGSPTRINLKLNDGPRRKGGWQHAYWPVYPVV